MCGISGILSKNKSDVQNSIEPMLECLTHRGPDFKSVKNWENVSFGHTRLAIIDLETGNQPMSDINERYTIIYNGELYNFKYLRAILVNEGYKFSTNSDTEVILNSYIHWGDNCLIKFRGMFAFVIHDTEKNEVFLARDHIGIKPLYYFSTTDTFAFASELQSLKKNSKFPAQICLRSLDQYLCFQYIPSPNTIYKNVYKLEPGHFLKFDLEKFSYRVSNFWNLEFSESNTSTERNLLSDIDILLKESVGLHLIADVEFGAFLSGGIDSTVILQYMRDILNQPIKTFTIGFKDSAYDESQYAAFVSKTFGTKHFHKFIETDAISILPDLVRHYGEPFGDSSAIPTYFVSKIASDHVKMVLSGDGGDELFGGYESYIQWMKIQSLYGVKRWKQNLYPIAQFLAPFKYISPRSVMNWLSIISYFNYEARKKLWKSEYISAVSTHSEVFENYFKESKNLNPLKGVQYSDIKTYLPNDILTKVDIASMFHSLEVRTPLVDRVLWEYMAQVPVHHYFRFHNGDYEGKLILKKLLANKFPDSFIYRKKMGFSIPLKQWIRADMKTANYINERLIGDESTLKPYFERQTIKEIIKSESVNQIWLLLFLEEWFRQNLN
jgi:asparagine synthase (glutamine-hydrolysing)